MIAAIKLNFGVLGVVVFWFAVLAVLGIAATFISLNVESWVVDKRTEIVRNSNSYVDTAETELFRKMGEYRELDVEIAEATSVEVKAGKRAQQRAILVDMRETASRLDEMPVEIAAFLAAN